LSVRLIGVVTGSYQCGLSSGNQANTVFMTGFAILLSTING
jgi:hypothetical protein